MEETNELLRQILERLTDSTKLVLTIEEAATRMGVSRPVMSNLVHTKGFPSFNVGRRVYIYAKGLEEWVRDQAGSMAQ